MEIKSRFLPSVCVYIHILCVKLHPVLQLLRDVLVPPLSQVGDDDPRVEGACVGPHPQLLDSFLLEVQEAYIVILLKKRFDHTNDTVF